MSVGGFRSPCNSDVSNDGDIANLNDVQSPPGSPRSACSLGCNSRAGSPIPARTHVSPAGGRSSFWTTSSPHSTMDSDSESPPAAVSHTSSESTWVAEGSGRHDSTCKVKFLVECEETDPGQRVYVAGCPSSLGAWNSSNAVPLSPEHFPMWTSNAVELPAGQIEFKLVIGHWADPGVGVRWEGGHNRSFNFEAGEATLTCTWGKAGAELRCVSTSAAAEAELTRPL